MGGRFGKRGDLKRKDIIRRSGLKKQKLSTLKTSDPRRKRLPKKPNIRSLLRTSNFMTEKIPHGVFELSQYKEQTRVFQGRRHAGDVLSLMLRPYQQDIHMILGIPAGGVPVGAVVSESLQIPFDIAVVSKITLPWNSEAGYGAVAFDGTVRLNEDLMAQIRISDTELRKGIEETTAKVRRRVECFRKKKPFPALFGQFIVLVDDGLASGFTMRVAIEALKKAGAGRIIVAVPTAHKESLDAIITTVDAVFCPNIRSGWRYAVADAYERWADVEESEVKKTLARVFKTYSPKEPVR